MKSLISYIKESHSVIPVDVICGRFQPLTKAHLNIMIDDHRLTGRKVIVLAQRSNKLDDKHPFPDELLEKQFDLVSNKYSFIEFHFTYNQSPANIDITKGQQNGWMKIMKEYNYDPHNWLCGTDRMASYEKMVNNYAKANGAYNLKVVEIKRTDDDISATKAREAIKNNDKKEFLKNCPDIVEPLFDEYKKSIDNI